MKQTIMITTTVAILRYYTGVVHSLSLANKVVPDSRLSSSQHHRLLLLPFSSTTSLSSYCSQRFISVSPSSLWSSSSSSLSSSLRGDSASVDTRKTEKNHCSNSNNQISHQQQQQQNDSDDLSLWKKSSILLPSSPPILSSSSDLSTSSSSFSSSSHLISNLLVLGDGDLSYSASIAPVLSRLGISLTATVLESHADHVTTYERSKRNIDVISSHGHQVRFGIDGTNLEHHFGDDSTTTATSSFDRITFNFPHWKGKTNTRKNRELISSIFQSSSHILPPFSELHMSFCSHQGGSTALTPEKWRQSWLAAPYAAEANLLLTDVVSPVDVTYGLSSHRGRDRPFWVGDVPELYKFVKVPKGMLLDKAVSDDDDDEMTTGGPCCRRLAYRHELHLVYPTGEGKEWDDDEEEGIRRMEDVIRKSDVVPPGVEVEVPGVQRISHAREDVDYLVFLVVYCGTKRPLSRGDAEGIKEGLYDILEEGGILRAELRQSRIRRDVSRPVPYRLLQSMIRDGVKW